MVHPGSRNRLKHIKNCLMKVGIYYDWYTYKMLEDNKWRRNFENDSLKDLTQNQDHLLRYPFNCYWNMTWRCNK